MKLFSVGVSGFDTFLQLTLHAALGCGMAPAGGNNCAAGAAAGVIGESVGELFYNNGNGLSKQNTIAVSPITGALAAAMISGPDDGDSVFAGSQIARNAVENNALSDGIGVSSLEEESQNFKESQDEANEKLKSVKTELQVDLADVAANSDNKIIKGAAFTGLTATNILFPESVEEIGLGVIGAGMTFASRSTTTLYRAIGPEELMDIKNTNIIRNLGSAEGKYFTDSAEHASSYAQQAVRSFGDEPYTIIKTQITTKSLNNISNVKVDGGIPAWVIPESQLQNMKPEILNFSPIPKK